MKTLLFFLSLPFSFCFGWEFIDSHEKLKFFQDREDVIMVCSTGRSGSTMLSDALDKALPKKTILKSHLLPPREGWKGKILFIFSNPDKADESIFHVSLEDGYWYYHFNRMETTDPKWLQKLGSTVNQNLEDNLLNYDALGIEEHLRQWLKLEKCPIEESCILAVKYEHLWDREVIAIIKNFCQLESFPLPEMKERGYPLHSVSEKERLIRKTYNLGTEQEPRYAVCDGARAIWESSPKVQSYRLGGG